MVGGSLVGSAIARGLQREGLTTVLLDEGDLAFRASCGNFGLVWVQSKGLGAPHYQRWTRALAEAWGSLADELQASTGLSCGLQQTGGVHLCLSDQEFEDRADRMARMKQEAGNYGYDYRMLDAREVRDMLPGLGNVSWARPGRLMTGTPTRSTCCTLCIAPSSLQVVAMCPRLASHPPRPRRVTTA